MSAAARARSLAARALGHPSSAVRTALPTPTHPEVDPSPTRARRRAGLVALLVFLAVGAAGLARHERPALHMPAARAIALGAQDPDLAPLIAARSDHAIVNRVDDDLVRVTYFDGGRAIATVGVRRDGSLKQGTDYRHNANAYGTPLSHLPALLVIATALFLLAVLRGRLVSVRTVDALALAGFVVPTILLDRGYLAVGHACVAVLLVYLAVRGVLAAVRGRSPRDRGVDAEPVLLERLALRHRTPRAPLLIGLAALLVTLLTTVMSTGEVDVAWASMEGATAILHGALPYGHLPGDVVHGDTYGLPMYLAYLPFAALWPVHDVWAEVTGALVASALAALLCVVGLVRTGSQRPGTPWPALIALLTFPSALIGFTSGTNDALVAVALIWALAWFTRPRASAALLTVAGLAKVAPLVLLPLWLARLRGRALAGALATCAAVGLATLAMLVALGGVAGPADMAHAMSFQLTRESIASVWTTLGLQALQPLAQAAALAIALGAATLVVADRTLAADPRRVAALVTATLAALQLAASHWAPLYLLWLAPPALVALLGPLGVRAVATERAGAAAGTLAAAR
jgi:hypothetical protein